jgi:hypothetical protein
MTASLPAFTLPPPSPALVLHEAAARLRGAAAGAGSGGRTPTPAKWYALMDNALGGPVGVFCGLLSPGVAEDLADLLDAVAVEAVRQARAGGTQETVTDGYPTTIARRILEAA